MMSVHEKLDPHTPRQGVTHRFTVGGLKGYITANCYPDGRLAEVFLIVKQVGTLERGMAHAVAILISIALQHGVPLSKIVDKLKGLTFEPQGVTSNPAIPMARSILDYVGRWLESKFLR